MKEGKRIKKWLLGAAVAVMTMMSAIPVSAARKTFTATVQKGNCLHIVNENISGNAISKYELQVIPKTSGARYDIVYAYGTEAMAMKDCRKKSSITNSTYFKANRSANRGIIACVKANSGTVEIRVVATSRKSNVKIKKSIMKNHSPLKSQKVTKGRKLWLKGTGSNITTLPLIISGNSTVVMQRNLNKNAFERYDFKDKYMYFRRYVNNKRTIKKNRSYASAYGSTRYYSCLIPANSKGVAYTGDMITKRGTITYYYPSDYLKVTGENRRAS